MWKVTIYTDGACSHNPGIGGWAAILFAANRTKEISGGNAQTTNNRMELTAAIQALSILNQPCNVDLYTDSAYLCNAFNQRWISSWLKNGWKTASKRPVENRDLWETLIKLSELHNIRWFKVKGHADNEHNNRCDALARKEIKRIQEELLSSKNVGTD